MIWMVAMVFSAEFILSQVMILLVAMALWERRDGFPWLRWRESLAANTRAWWRYPPNRFIAIPFLLVLVSLLWSSDMDYSLERLRIKLPFLVLPWAFMGIPRLSRRGYHLVLYFLVALMTVACLYVGINYLLDYRAIHELMGRGKPMPTPSNHIRFSLVLSFAILSGLLLVVRRFFLRFAWERWLIPGMTLFLFVFIHVLSVRSGLLVLYVTLLVWSLWYVMRTRRWGVALAAGLVLLLLPVAAYQLFPSFRMKANYARWDLLQYRQGKGANYSDSERLVSLEAGLNVGKRSPWIGVGAGDLKREIRAEYARSFPEIEHPKMPHNQLVSLFAGTGILGLLLFLAGFFYPLFYKKNFKHPLFLALHVLIFLSFLMENTIENNFGVSFYLLFLLLGLNRVKSEG